MTKPWEDDDFVKWESRVFGFGYGSGELHTIEALVSFILLIDDKYDCRNLEASLGSTVTWLLINTLCHADILEYGTSPRFGWLTDEGKALQTYIRNKTIEDLVLLACNAKENY